MRSINCRKKTTTARTDYYEISKADKDFILGQCQDIVDFEKHAECPYSVRDQLNKPNARMPGRSAKYGGGRNSAKSMCEGVIDNFNHGQYDLSDKTMKGVEEAFRVAAQATGVFEEVTFNEVATLPKPKPVAQPTPGSETFNSLFG